VTTDDRLYQLHRQQDEIAASVRDELARHSDSELMELVQAHLDQPEAVIVHALKHGQAGKLMAMALLPIQSELIRRAEVRVMEAGV
jgi:hypothetical protein